MDTSTDPLLGKVIGGYCLEKLLGRGKLTAVYHARTKEFCQISELLVIIFLLPETISHQMKVRFQERFFTEAARLVTLQYPSIVPLYGYGEHDGYLYFLSPNLSGETLQARLKRKKSWTASEVLSLLTPIANTLDYLHQRGWAYQCFNPSHVLLLGTTSTHIGEALLLNGLGLFQILRMRGLIDEEDASAYDHLKSIAGTYLGMPTYLAPEVVKGKEGDARSDVYSLGVLLFEMLSGKPLFTGETYQNIVQKHIDEPIPSLSEAAPDLPVALELIVNHALHRNAFLRFQSSGELLTTYSLLLSERLQTSQSPSFLVYQIEKMRAVTPARLKHLQFSSGSLPLQVESPPERQQITKDPFLLPLVSLSTHTLAEASQTDESIMEEDFLTEEKQREKETQEQVVATPHDSVEQKTASKVNWLDAMLHLLPQTTSHTVMPSDEQEEAFTRLIAVPAQPQKTQMRDDTWPLIGPSLSQPLPIASQTKLRVSFTLSPCTGNSQKHIDQIPARGTQQYIDQQTKQSHKNIITMSEHIQQIRARLQVQSQQHSIRKNNEPKVASE